MNNYSGRFATKKLMELLKTHEVEPLPNYNNICEKDLTFLNEPFDENEMEDNYNITENTLTNYIPKTETYYYYFFTILTGNIGKVHYSKLYDLIVYFLNENNNKSHFFLQLPNFIHTLLLINELPLPQIALKIIETEFVWDYRMKVRKDFGDFIYKSETKLQRRLFTSNYVKDLRKYEKETENDIRDVENDIYNEIKEEYDEDLFMDATGYELEDLDDYGGVELLTIMENLDLHETENYKLYRTKILQNCDADSLLRLMNRFSEKIFSFPNNISAYYLDEFKS